MKRLFLTSQVQFVAASIAKKLGDDTKKPGVFITTPLSGRKHTAEELEWHNENRRQLKNSGFNFVNYDITGKTSADIVHDLGKYEIMYVEGGNPFNMLKHSLENKFGSYVTERINNGLIYMGTSAGSIIVGPDIRTAERAGHSAADSGLSSTASYGIVNFAILPHWGNADKRKTYMETKLPIAYTVSYPIIPLTDTQYVEVKDAWYRIVDVTKE